MLPELIMWLGALWFLLMLLFARMHHWAQEKDRWRR